VEEKRSAQAVAERWDRLEHWAPSGFNWTLQGGAAAEEVSNAEQAFGACLPLDYRSSVQIHNGQIGQFHGSLFGDARLLPLQEVVQEQKWYQGTRFLPVAEKKKNGGQLCLCILTGTVFMVNGLSNVKQADSWRKYLTLF
jgi:cell wall assembly regulator SMI1